MQLSCSCPDAARVCKHLAAVFYVMADRIDIDPFFIFRFRGLDLKAEMRKCGIDVDRAVKVKPLDASEILSGSAALMSEKRALMLLKAPRRTKALQLLSPRDPPPMPPCKDSEVFPTPGLNL